MTAVIVRGVLMILVPVVVYLVVSAAATGRLPRNRWVGLRTTASLSSETAWRAGHRAAVPRLRWSVVAGVAGGAVIFGNLLLTDNDSAGLLPLGLLIMMLVTIFQAAARGIRAAELVASVQR